jgi:hypothetical protein
MLSASHDADNAGRWGVRIESALLVRRVETKREFNPGTWLGFERITCVPIQTTMVDAKMLTGDEKRWLKVSLSPYLSTCLCISSHKRAGAQPALLRAAEAPPCG